jgi:ribosomal protein L17
MTRNLAASLIEHERVVTTLPKAKVVKPFVEKLVTMAKEESVHHRRLVFGRPGCDIEARKAMYQEVYEILADDLPWIWISTTVIQQAAQANVENWDPHLGGYHGARWNLDGWTISD